MTASPAATVAGSYLQARLAYEMDVLDVAKGLALGQLVLVDTRRKESWDHGHVPGAIHLPDLTVNSELSGRLDTDVPVVVYGWGPGCNGGTRAAAALSKLGYSVREMSGGFEYWCRTGLPFETAEAGATSIPPDPLVTAEKSGRIA